MKPKKKNLKKYANQLAEEAHRDHFPSRRGIFSSKTPGYFTLYDNNPYNDATRRPREHAVIKEVLANRGVEVLAEGAYPAKGEQDAGYTVAIVFAAKTDEEIPGHLHAIQATIQALHSSVETNETLN